MPGRGTPVEIGLGDTRDIPRLFAVYSPYDGRMMAV